LVFFSTSNSADRAVTITIGMAANNTFTLISFLDFILTTLYNEKVATWLVTTWRNFKNFIEVVKTGS